ncbi:secretory lipase [Truncatella angustata]|uniref:Secretory lipase n=1 Tax=Truncatella angustata TaxID=152316 RepID=A0A9P8UKJ8_9PEZI|nr:secretory lipase [Truncatella angustata]KAH6654220.1 secretory lipase [Truncatella angustata]
MICLLASQCLAQQLWPAAEARTNTFNSTYGPLNSTQATSLIRTANISEAQADAVLVAVEFERSNWAGSAVQLDPFYQEIPKNSSTATPGSPLKIEQHTNNSLYTLPAGVSLSRMLFTTKTLNGTTVPASSYVLWPWLPKRFSNVTGLPVVGWGHGTSGWSGECGPSHTRNLWYQYSAPYVLALQGYIVVAPDYAGLGLDHDVEGNFIAHQYTANPAHGNDLIYAVQAAQEAWPILSKEFVLMGHSQGGSAVWGAAEQLAREPIEGYLGGIAGSPLPSLGGLIELVVESPLLWVGAAKVATGLQSIFPTFQLSDWLSDEGIRLTEILQELQGCQSVALELLATPNLQADGWNKTWYLPAFINLTESGGKEFAGPMLILHGSADKVVPEMLAATAVNQTCEALPDSQLHYTVLDGVSHVAVLYAGQQIWLDWIADRFNGVPVAHECVRQTLSPGVGGQTYQAEFDYTLQYPFYPYETA